MVGVLCTIEGYDPLVRNNARDGWRGWWLMGAREQPARAMVALDPTFCLNDGWFGVF